MGFSHFSMVRADRQIIYEVYKNLLIIDLENYGLNCQFKEFNVPNENFGINYKIKVFGMMLNDLIGLVLYIIIQ